MNRALVKPRAAVQDGVRGSTPRPALLVAAPACLSALVFVRASLDVFNTTKLAVAAVTVALVAFLVLAEGPSATRLQLPRGRWVAAGAAFAGVQLVAALAGDAPWRSIIGSPGRHGGVLLSFIGVVLAVLTARVVSCSPHARLVRRAVVRTFLATSVPVVAYALLQAAGADIYEWATVEGGPAVFSTFGNADFASAWIGIVGLLAAGEALASTGPRDDQSSAAVSDRLRGPALMWALTGACLLASWSTGSLQGPVILGLGSAALAADRFGSRVRQRLSGRQVLVVAVLVGFSVLAVVGSGVAGQAGASLESRLPKWQAALRMTAEAPVLGHGPDLYGDRYFDARGRDVAVADGLRRSVDNAHNLPLHLLAGSGVLGLGSWSVFVLLLPAVAVRRTIGSLRDDPGRAAVVLAFGGYLLQAQVSIDVPPLSLLGMTLLGLVIGESSSDGPSSADLIGRPATRERTAVTALTVLLLTALLVGSGQLSVRAWRADLHGFDAQTARFESAPADAARATERASALAWWSGVYEARQGDWLAANGIVQQALVHHMQAASREPRNLGIVLNLARTLVAAGRDAQAVQAYEQVVEIDPHTPEVLAEAGLHALSQGAVEPGRDLLARAVEGLSEPPQIWLDALAEGVPAAAEEALMPSLDAPVDGGGS